ncbi:MAG: hypothetical protein ACM31C_31230 [Acidobacteriota bacterium]
MTDTTLCFRANGLPWRACSALVVAFLIVTLGAFEVASDDDVMHDLFGIACVAVATAIAVSAAYAAAGSLELRHADGAWLITRSLGRWRRHELVLACDVERVEYFEPPGFVVWPSLASTHLVLHLRSGRLVAVGAGLWLRREDLVGVRDLLSPAGV